MAIHLSLYSNTKITMNKLILIIIIFIPSIIAAQSLYPKHQAGLGFSNISGGIINYQIELNPQDAFKFGTLVFYNSDTPPDDLYLIGNIGAEYQNNLTKQSNQRLYWLTGASFWYMQDKNTTYKTINDVKYKIIDNKIKKLINLGIGIGYEYKIHPQIAINADIGAIYQFALQNDTNFNWIFDRTQQTKSAISLSIGIGLRYCFY